ncbi:hypothetical protein [Komagataeibacter xylinus]
MATTALNIVQQIGDPNLTIFCATFLGWQSPAATIPHAIVDTA